MEPKDFEFVTLTSLKCTPGNQISYNQENTNVIIKTDSDLSDPCFEASFKLTPGTIKVSVPPVRNGVAPLNVTVLPDLSKFGAKLEIYPLEKGSFNFSITKQPFKQCDSKTTINYKSEKQQFTLIAEPHKNFGDLDVSALVEVNSLNAVPDTRLCVLYKNLTARVRYLAKENEFRTGAFYKLLGVGPFCAVAGGLNCYYGIDQKQLTGLNLYLKASKGNTTASLVASPLNKNIALHYQGKYPIKNHQIAIGSTVGFNCADKFTPSVKIGTEFITQCGEKIALSIDDSTKTVIACSVPHCNAINAAISLSLEVNRLTLDSEKIHPAFGLNVAFNQ